MARSKSGQTPEEELWDFVQRSLEEPREWLYLDDREQWESFVDELLTGRTGLAPTEAQMLFFRNAPDVVIGALGDVGIAFERGSTPAGFEFGRFRSTSSGQFIGLDYVKEVLQGYFYGL